MPRKKKQPPLALFDEIARFQATGLQPTQRKKPEESGAELPASMEAFIQFLVQNPTKKVEEMYCFIMYDIENNKVRRLVAKYLERKGCIRVQKSIFFAKLHRNMYREVGETLREIQEAYEGADSILLVPVGEDALGHFVIIGRKLEFKMMAHVPHTLFF